MEPLVATLVKAATPVPAAQDSLAPAARLKSTNVPGIHAATEGAALYGFTLALQTLEESSMNFKHTF